MKRALALVAFIALAAVFAWHEFGGARRDTEAADNEAREDAATALPAQVVLTPAARALADLDVVALAVVSRAIEQQVTGLVADRGAWLADDAALRAAHAAFASQQGLLDAQRGRLERLRGFAARGEITVARELNALEVAVRRDTDVAAERAAQVSAAQARMAARWGAALTDTPELAAALAAPAAQLIAFAAAGTPPVAIFVAADERRAEAVAARVLGAAPATVGSGSAPSWMALATDPRLRVGMPLTVWVADGGAAAAGVLLPHAALVWHGGAQWFYVEQDGNAFARHKLPETAVALDDGVIVSDGLAAGTRVVVRGAQALLAEELHQRIPSEDDD